MHRLDEARERALLQKSQALEAGDSATFVYGLFLAVARGELTASRAGEVIGNMPLSRRHTRQGTAWLVQSLRHLMRKADAHVPLLLELISIHAERLASTHSRLSYSVYRAVARAAKLRRDAAEVAWGYHCGALGYKLFLLGKVDQANARFHEAIASLRSALPNSTSELAMILERYAATLAERGLLSAADDFLSEALYFCRHSLEATLQCLSTLAVVVQRLGRFEESIRIQRSLRSEVAQLHSPVVNLVGEGRLEPPAHLTSFKAISLMNEGVAHQHLHNHKLALPLLKSAAEEFLYIRDGKNAAHTLMLAANSCHHLGMNGKAERFYLQAESVLNEEERVEETQTLTVWVKINRAMLLLDDGHKAEAWSSVKDLPVTGSATTRGYFHTLRAIIRGKIVDAESEVRSTSGVNEVVGEFVAARNWYSTARMIADVGMDNPAFLLQRIEADRAAIEFCVSHRLGDLAYRFVSDAKCSLLSGWHESQHPDAIMDVRREMSSWLLRDRRRRRLALELGSESESERHAATSRLERETAYRAQQYSRLFRDSMLRRDSKDRLSVADAPAAMWHIEEIRRGLAPSTAILDFRLDLSKPLIFLLERSNRPKLIASKARPKFLSRIFRWQKHEVFHGNRSQARRSTALLKILFRAFFDVDPGLKTSGRCYLIPHGWSHLIPLHATMTRDGHTLSEQREVLYLPGASLLAATIKNDKGEDEPLLKTWPPVDVRGAGGAIAEGAAIRMLSIVNPERVDASKEAKDNEAVMTLPFAEWEGEFIRTKLGIPPDRLTMLAGADAKDWKTVSQWRQADIVHFSCHGSGEPQFSLIAHLRLADDVLMAHDVLYRCPRLKDGALVILNGCETYVKDHRAIDEGLGLASMFLAKGAGMVLCTMWSVSDYASAQVVTEFLRQVVKKHQRPTLALRTAIKHLRSISWEKLVKDYQEWIATMKRLTRSGEKPLPAERQRALRQLDELVRGSGKACEKPFDHPVYWTPFQLVGRFPE